MLIRDMIKKIDYPICEQMKLINISIKYFYSEPSIRTRPSLLGQHIDEIFKDILGMDASAIEELKADGVVA